MFSCYLDLVETWFDKVFWPLEAEFEEKTFCFKYVVWSQGRGPNLFNTFGEGVFSGKEDANVFGLIPSFRKNVWDKLEITQFAKKQERYLKKGNKAPEK